MVIEYCHNQTVATMLILLTQTLDGAPVFQVLNDTRSGVEPFDYVCLGLP